MSKKINFFSKYINLTRLKKLMSTFNDQVVKILDQRISILNDMG